MIICCFPRTEDGRVHGLPAIMGAALGTYIGVDPAGSGSTTWGGYGNSFGGRVPNTLRPTGGPYAVGNDGNSHHWERYSGGVGVSDSAADSLRDSALGRMSPDW